MPVYHFSEDSSIGVFRPHVAKTALDQEQALVWAIDAWHAPMYYVPRNCPRACFWAGASTTPEDRERWLHGLEPRFVMLVEAGWLERIRSTTLYRYELPDSSFEACGHAGGHQVSRELVTPLSVAPLADLLSAIASAGVELRIAARLGPLWRRVSRQSTLEFSGTRLRNALGYPQEFGVEEPT